MPKTIESTESSLRTAQESAKVIDSVLSTLSSIPLIGSSIGYNPQVPLDQALGEVADSLTGLPDSFANMADSLKATSSNLETFEADLTVMAESIGEIEKNVAQYRYRGQRLPDIDRQAQYQTVDLQGKPAQYHPHGDAWADDFPGLDGYRPVRAVYPGLGADVRSKACQKKGT